MGEERRSKLRGGVGVREVDGGEGILGEGSRGEEVGRKRRGERAGDEGRKGGIHKVGGRRKDIREKGWRSWSWGSSIPRTGIALGWGVEEERGEGRGGGRTG